VTSDTAFGRIWELNDDSYVTISDPGEMYAYELDEGDEDDQDMSSTQMRRGTDNGWGGKLQADALSELPVGSREWIARRAYELVCKSNHADMFRWTRARKSPPEDISNLFPDAPSAPPQLARTTLFSVAPDPDSEMLSPEEEEDEARMLAVGSDQSGFEKQNGDSPVLDNVFASVNGSADNQEGRMTTSQVKARARATDEDTTGFEAMERAVKFPCVYKFKVVGSGDDFVASITSDMERVIGRAVPQTAFEFEPAGRYQRIIINVEVESARQVTELYDAIRTNPLVKFSYG
jgi:putative lipoic acid-binding regulatory protein